jgi:hypothetical protein
MEIVRYMLDHFKPAQRYLFRHDIDPKKRMSENTLNTALKRMGYRGLLTGHGIRATISTALNEVGYAKVWVDAQLSHVDPNKVSATYNHAEYVEQRRRMMQDWADRLDLFEQNQVEAASLLPDRASGRRSRIAERAGGQRAAHDGAGFPDPAHRATRRRNALGLREHAATACGTVAALGNVGAAIGYST